MSEFSRGAGHHAGRLRPVPHSLAQPVYLVDGARTPFLRARQGPGPFTPVDLAVQCGRPLLLRQPFPASAFNTVILGCVNVIPDEMNPARVAALRLGMGDATTAYTVQINCGSGMLAIDHGFRAIQTGQADLILAGGTEALSHAPLVWQRAATAWFARLALAKTWPQRLAALMAWRPHFLKPVIGLERGLTDPVSNLNMGQTAEVLAHRFGISREAADTYAVLSHQRLARAQAEGTFNDEIVAAFDTAGRAYLADDGVRPDTSVAQLARLKPVFERPWGKVTAGNASQVTDGASWVVLASETAVQQYGLRPLARILDSEWAALDPALMGLGPVLASTAMLRRQGLSRTEVGLWELNEAFAAQVLACQAAWQDATFCQAVLDLSSPFGAIEPERLNVDGGAIALGHPVGASGNRIVLHLARALRQHGQRLGVATACIGGGQGGAMLLEAV